MILAEDFASLISTVADKKGLPEDIIIASLQSAMSSAYKKSSPGNQNKNVEARIAPNGELTIEEIRTVVDEVKNPDAELTVEEAAEEGYADLELGDEIRKTVNVSPNKFGRIAAQTARQVIIQRLKDAERQCIYEQYADKIGNVVVGSIFKVEGDQILINLNEKSEAVLPKDEKINSEDYRMGMRLKFFVLDVRQTSKGPRIVVSRTHPGLLRRLIEVEVPEIQDGTVEIRSIVREAGLRAKVAVHSLNPDVEPLGACVGRQGMRIKSLSSDLAGERIDVIAWSDDPYTFIRNALSPAKIVKIEPVEGVDKAVTAYVHSEELSLAIGKAGQNVRLAAKITGWKIDIKVLEAEKLPTMKELFVDIASIVKED